MVRAPRRSPNAAGVSETLVFKHFKTKHNLYRQALEHLFGPHPVFGELEPAMSAGDDHQVLFLLARHVIKHCIRDERIVRLTLFSGMEGMGFEEHEDATVKTLQDYLTRRMAGGHLRDTDPGLAARFFIYAVFMYVGDIHLKLTGTPAPVDEDQAAKALADIFMQGLRP